MSAISDKFELLQQTVINLGDPIGPEEAFPDGGARQVYTFGRIYFHPRVGAFECHGLILEKYLELAEQDGALGYPTSDESDFPSVAGGKMNAFENGALFFDPSVGVIVQLGEAFLSPTVVVKLFDTIPIALAQDQTVSLDDVVALLGPLGLNPAVDAIRALLPDLRFGRLFESLSPDELQALVDRAQTQTPDYVPPNFNTFLQIQCPLGFNTEPLVAALQLWAGVVEDAYTAGVPSDPVVGTTNPFFTRQGYLTAAPRGIGIRVAWAEGADGTPSSFIDLEQGWLLTHEDLPQTIQLLAGTLRATSRPHGCAVLGVVLAIDNTVGVVGIAPGTTAAVISYFDPRVVDGSPRVNINIADRIATATTRIGLGDVLLLEVQVPGTVDGRRTVIAAESERGIFDAIRLATAVNVSVVEAAGNGNAPLDNFVAGGQRVLQRGVRESGAIMVGSCRSSVPHARLASSNFGTRVDCYAWGEDIVTTGNPTQPAANNAYWLGPGADQLFGGTSGASAIIAGVCLLVQHLKVIRDGAATRLTSAEVRRIVSAAANGTASFALADQIGSMPDFAKIIGNEFPVI
jgi:hypothetical protein